MSLVFSLAEALNVAWGVVAAEGYSSLETNVKDHVFRRTVVRKVRASSENVGRRGGRAIRKLVALPEFAEFAISPSDPDKTQALTVALGSDLERELEALGEQVVEQVAAAFIAAAYGDASPIERQIAARLEKLDETTLQLLNVALDTSHTLRPPTAIHGRGSSEGEVATPQRFGEIPLTPYFVGRSGLLASVRQTLAEDNAVSLTQAFVGLGGIGKSQLAAALCHHDRDSYDLIAWIRSETRDQIVHDMAQLAAVLRIQDSEAMSPDLSARQVKSFLESTPARWLVVFDNLGTARSLSGLMPRSPRGRCIITTRNESAIHDMARIAVPPLRAADGADYLAQSTRQSDHEAAKHVADALGGLPLALSHASSYINEVGIPIAEYLEHLDLPSSVLFANHPGIFYEQTLQTTWRASIRAAESAVPGSRRLLLMLSLMAPDRFPRLLLRHSRAFARTNGAVVTVPALQSLARYSMVTLSRSAVWTHRMVQKITADEAAQAGDLATGIDTAIEVFSEQATALLGKHHLPEDTSSLTWSGALAPHIESLSRKAWSRRLESGYSDRLAALSRRKRFISMSGLASLAIREPRASDSSSEEIDALLNLLLSPPRGGFGSSALEDLLLLWSTGGQHGHDDGGELAAALQSVAESGAGIDAAILLAPRLAHRLGLAGVQSWLAQDAVAASLSRTTTATLGLACWGPLPTSEWVLARLKDGVEVGSRNAVESLGTRAGRDLAANEAIAVIAPLADRHESLALRLAALLALSDPDAAHASLRDHHGLGPQILIKYCSSLIERGEVPEAIGELERARFENAQAAVKLAKLLEEEDKDLDQALEVLAPHVGLDITSTVKYAQISRRLGRHANAEQALESIAHRSSEAASHLATALHAKGDAEGAATALRPHLQESPLARRTCLTLLRADRDANASERPSSPTLAEALGESLLSVVTSTRQQRSSAPLAGRQSVGEPSSSSARPSLPAIVRQIVASGARSSTSEAISALRLLAKSDANPKRLRAIAAGFVQLGEPAEAIAVMLSAKRLTPAIVEDVVTYLDRSLPEDQLRDIAAHLRPTALKSATACLALAELIEEIDGPRAALEFLEQAGDSDQVLIRLADGYLRVDMPDHALTVLESHLPRVSIAYKYAELCRQTSELDRGINHLDKVAKNSVLIRFYRDSLEGLANTPADRDEIIAAADQAWFAGDSKGAIEVLHPWIGRNTKMTARACDYLFSLGGPSHDIMRALLSDSIRRMKPLLVSVAEYGFATGDTEWAVGLLQEHADIYRDAALGAAWLRYEQGQLEQAVEYIERCGDRKRLGRVREKLLKGIKSNGRAMGAASALVDLGHPLFALSIIRRASSSDRRSAVFESMVLRKLLLLQDAVGPVQRHAKSYMPAAVALAVARLQQGDTHSASKAIESYSGKTRAIKRLAPLLRSSLRDPVSAIEASMVLTDLRLNQEAYDVIWCYWDPEHPAISAIEGELREKSSDPFVISVARLRTRLLIGDQNRRLKLARDPRNLQTAPDGV